jgi:hypothetical protein
MVGKFCMCWKKVGIIWPSFPTFFVGNISSCLGEKLGRFCFSQRKYQLCAWYPNFSVPIQPFSQLLFPNTISLCWDFQLWLNYFVGNFASATWWSRTSPVLPHLFSILVVCAHYICICWMLNEAMQVPPNFECSTAAKNYRCSPKANANGMLNIY